MPGGTLNRKVIRIQLIRKELRLKDLAVKAGIEYDRLVKVMDGYRPARPEEVRAISGALELNESDVCPIPMAK